MKTLGGVSGRWSGWTNWMDQLDGHGYPLDGHVWEGSKPRLNEDPSDHVWQGCQNGSKSDPLWMAILTLFEPPVSHWTSLAKRAQKDEGFGCKTDLQWVQKDTHMPIWTHLCYMAQI